MSYSQNEFRKDLISVLKRIALALEHTKTEIPITDSQEILQHDIAILVENRWIDHHLPTEATEISRKFSRRSKRLGIQSTGSFVENKLSEQIKVILKVTKAKVYVPKVSSFSTSELKDIERYGLSESTLKRYDGRPLKAGEQPARGDNAATIALSAEEEAQVEQQSEEAFEALNKEVEDKENNN